MQSESETITSDHAAIGGRGVFASEGESVEIAVTSPSLVEPERWIAQLVDLCQRASGSVVRDPFLPLAAPCFVSARSGGCVCGCVCVMVVVVSFLWGGVER